MTWKDNIRQASFRGAVFGVESHESDLAGRRLHVHEFGGATASWPEDLGPKSRRFNIEAFVIGDDYMTARDALVSACSEAGAGTLIHPWLGSWQVHCESCRLTETSTRGRMASLKIEFVVDSRQPALSVKADNVHLLNQAVDAGALSAMNDFTTVFNASSLPAFVAEGSVADIREALDTIAGLGKAPHLIKVAREAIPGLVHTPGELGVTVFRLIKDGASGGGSAPRVLESLAGFGNNLPSIPRTTATRLQQSANRTAVVSLVRRAGILEYARLLPSIPFTHKGEAHTVRDRLGGQLDHEMGVASKAGSDGVFEAFRSLRGTVVQHIRSREPGLARLIKVAGTVTEPALVSAYRLYADPFRADELVARNRLRHPGFVPGGRTLEALSNARGSHA